MAWDRVDLGETEATVLAGMAVGYTGGGGFRWRRMVGPVLWSTVAVHSERFLEGSSCFGSRLQSQLWVLGSSSLPLFLSTSVPDHQGTRMERQLATQWAHNCSSPTLCMRQVCAPPILPH